MSRSRRVRRTATAAALALALAPGLAACGATADAPTLKYYAPADGVLGKLGDLRALNVLVVVPAGGVSGSAVMSMSLVNQGAQPDTLTGVTVAGQPAQVTGPTQLAPQSSLSVGGPDAKTQVVVTTPPKAGTLAPVQLQFQQAGTLSLQVPVVEASGYYNRYVAPSAEATASPTPSTSASASPSSSASPQPAQASPAQSPATGANSSTSPNPTPAASNG
ncbi:MAG TPA: hypothetical protein VFS29_01200 [Motilibacteraceae bacterium]|nr:hypothetical protein [Motilibacteraceae bacterium]